MKVAIYSRGLDVDQEGQLLILLEELTRQRVKICLFKSLTEHNSAVNMLPIDFSIFTTHKDLDESIDYIISLGGDGTMLDTAPDFQCAINRMRAELSLEPLGLDVIKRFVGKGSENLIRQVLGVDFGETEVDAQFETALASYQRHYLAIKFQHL